MDKRDKSVKMGIIGTPIEVPRWPEWHQTQAYDLSIVLLVGALGELLVNNAVLKFAMKHAPDSMSAEEYESWFPRVRDTHETVAQLIVTVSAYLDSVYQLNKEWLDWEMHHGVLEMLEDAEAYSRHIDTRVGF